VSTFSYQRGGASVLVVEDYADTADSLAVLLRLQGHRVHIARTGAEALATSR